MLVQIVHSLTDLLENVAGLEFRKDVPLVYVVVMEGRAVDHLGENVVLVLLLANINKADDIFLWGGGFIDMSDAVHKLVQCG